MNDRRSSQRRRTVLKGRIVFNNRCSILDCTVRDLSDTGARIYFADVSEIPLEFQLEISNRRMRVPGRLVWSRGANHGVMFLNKLKAWNYAPRAAVA